MRMYRPMVVNDGRRHRSSIPDALPQDRISQTAYRGLERSTAQYLERLNHEAQHREPLKRDDRK